MQDIHIEGETFETALVPWPPRKMAVDFQSVEDTIPAEYAAQERELINAKAEEARKEGRNFEDRPQYGATAHNFFNLKPEEEHITLPISQITYGRQEIHRRVNNGALTDGSFPNVLAVTEGLLTADKDFAYVRRGSQAAYYGDGQVHALIAGHAPPGELPKPEELSLDWWIANQEKTEIGFEPEEITDRQFLGLVFDRAGYKPEIVLTATTSLDLDQIREKHKEAVDSYEVRRGGIFPVPGFTQGIINEIIRPYHDKDKHVPPGFAHAVLAATHIGGTSALERINRELRHHGAKPLEYSLRER